MAEFDRIVNEIVEDLLYFPKVRKHHLDAVGECEFKAYILGIAGALK